mmetsp:Transcript_20900/g.30109  ORF Transcript_20900/g.30109 Transcript_20900/m.30109 type:complete len:140 (+) Transcript_20900:191-610(+)
MNLSSDDDGFTAIDNSHRSLSGDPVWWPVYRAKYGKRTKRCKDVPTIPENGTQCTPKRIGDYTCFFGDQSCADSSQHPKVKCDCLGDGRWNCVDYQPCPEQATERPAWTVCPEKHPLDFAYKLTCKSDFLVCNKILVLI